MLTLAIDSSQETCTVALGEDSNTICETHFRHEMGMLRRLVPTIDYILRESGRSQSEIALIIVALGPGSFTGLRIGVTTAKSLAFALGCKLVGVGTLEAMAFGIAPTQGALICPMIHARKDEAYWALYDANSSREIVAPNASTVIEAIEEIRTHGAEAVFVGTGAENNRDAITAKFGGAARFAPEWAGYSRGSALLKIGFEKLNNGDSSDPLALAPMYIRKPTPVVKMETGEIKPKA